MVCEPTFLTTNTPSCTYLDYHFQTFVLDIAVDVIAMNINIRMVQVTVSGNVTTDILLHLQVNRLLMEQLLMEQPVMEQLLMEELLKALLVDTYMDIIINTVCIIHTCNIYVCIF